MKTKEMLSSRSSTNIPFVKLTDDMLFKDIFGSKKGRIFLEDLLECYYKLKPGTMHNQLMVTTEYHYERDGYNEKDTRSDIVVIFQDKFINIEIYRVFNKKSLLKSRHYVMKISTNQLEVSGDYEKLKKVTQINFIEKDEVKISEEFKSTRKLFDLEMCDDISIDFILFDKKPSDEYNGSRFHKYVKFMNANSYEERREIAKGDEKLMNLDELIRKFCTEEDLAKDYDNVNWDKEIYEESGMLKGKKEEKIAIAKKMLDEEEPLEKIIKYTGLDQEQLESFKK